MVKTKHNPTVNGDATKYKQLDITAFLVSTAKPRKVIPTIKLNRTKRKIVPKKMESEDQHFNAFEDTATPVIDSNSYTYPEPLPAYRPPLMDIISVESSDDEEHVSPKRQKVSIGVFQFSKTNLVSKTSKPPILQRYSNSDGSLSVPGLHNNNVPIYNEVMVSTSVSQLSTVPRVSDISRQIRTVNTGVSDSPTMDVKTSAQNYMDNFRHIYDFVSSHKHLSSLFTNNEMKMMEMFLNGIDERYAYLCIRLFIRIQKWSNVFKVKTDIQLAMTDLEVKEMYECLLNLGFVVADMTGESPIDLLKLLSVADIKAICRSFKLKVIKSKKDEMIQRLLHNCNHQPVLVPLKDTKAILMDRILEKMGICIKLSPVLHKTLQQIHLLYSFTTNEFQSPSDLYFFLLRIKTKDIKLPFYNISRNTAVFPTREEFHSFAEAVECRTALDDAQVKKQRNYILELCELSYQKLVELGKRKHQKISHLIRYTAGYVYTKALYKGCTYLSKHYPEQVENFLTFLLRNNTFCSELQGTWYSLLVTVQYNHLKQYEKAAETVIEALNCEHFCEVDYFILCKQAENIKKKKTNRLPKLIADRICFAQSGKKVPSIEIRATLLNGVAKTSKKLYIENIDGEKVIRYVEQFALRHYYNSGYPNGIHCEGRLIWTIFSILLWDQMYDDDIPHVFISDIQHLPLDLYTKEFYTNRKDDIDKQLLDIQSWCKDELTIHVTKYWKKYSVTRSLLDTNLHIDHGDIVNIIICIGLERLVKIFKRLLSNMRVFRSGFPDLFVWNAQTRTYKFVEVKSDNDRLSPQQELWLKFLEAEGCNVELCHVHSIGAKQLAGYKKRQ